MHNQKGMFIDKKSCINKKPKYNDGEWEMQFGIYNPLTGTFGCSMNENFDENSKSKLQNNNPCIPKVIYDDCNNNKKLTTKFNEQHIDVKDKLLKNNSTKISDRYNNHNPVIGDEFARPPSINRDSPEPINDPDYKPYNYYIIPPVRYPQQTSDCSTLYNNDRYKNNNDKLYFEPCSMPS